MPKSPRKSPAAPAPGDLVKPKHGKGLLRRGSKPGTNAGGSGRPPSALRAKMRGSLEARLHIAEEVADNPLAAAADRLRALDFLAKYGLGTKQEVTGEDGAPVQSAVVILPALDPRP